MTCTVATIAATTNKSNNNRNNCNDNIIKVVIMITKVKSGCTLSKN